MTLLGDDSPFLHLPQDLNRTQQLFLDAIRYAIEMSDLAYRRLRTELIGISARAVVAKANVRQPSEDLAQIFSDAFTFVDNANRLRTLLEAMPQLKKRSPDLTVFLRKLHPAKDFRNPAQHLATEIRALAETDQTTWGWLFWIYGISPDKFHFFSSMAGATRETTSPPWKYPGGELIRGPVDFIQLSAYGHQLNISELHRSLEEFVPDFEAALRRAFPAGGPTLGSDFIIRIDAVPGQPEQRTEP